MNKIKQFFLCLTLAGLWASCEKESYVDSGSAELKFSEEEVFFDTIFQTLGSSTRRFKAYNRNDQKLKINNIRLMGGANSVYKINIDGRPASEISDYTLRPNDSMYLFAEVKINPNDGDNPFLVKDSIAFSTNGSTQYLDLVAYGRNAHVHRRQDSIPNGATTWDSDLPHLIVDYLIVDSNETLTIPEGTEVFATGNASLFVFGTLQVNGSKDNPVTFQGARPEEAFVDEPGQWQGIRLLPSSKDNFFNYALLNEGTVGIQVDSSSVNQNPKLDFRNGRIRNMATAGIQGFTADIVAFNSIISSACGHLVSGRLGGSYSFFHCTFVASNCQCSPEDPAIYFGNSPFEDQAGAKTFFDLNLTLFNSIVWGYKAEEVAFAKIRSEENEFNAAIQSTFLKTEKEGLDAAGNILNEDPLFNEVCQYDFTVEEGSPLVNSGTSLDSFPDTSQLRQILKNDLEGKTRDPTNPDLGALEMNF